MNPSTAYPYRNWIIEVFYNPHEHGYFWKASDGTCKLDSLKQDYYETETESLAYAKREIDWMIDD